MTEIKSENYHAKKSDAENPTDKWMARNPRQKAYHSKVSRTKSLLKNSDVPDGKKS